MKKGFVHIKEYDLTKNLVDVLEIDIEDEYTLTHGISDLYYKNKQLLLPAYKDFKSFSNKGVILRPFTNQAHAQFLIDMFSEENSCTVLFEYSVSDKNDKNYDGKFIVTDDDNKKNKKTYTFNNINSISVLMSALLLKAILGHDSFKGLIKDIVKVDKKIEGK